MIPQTQEELTNITNEIKNPEHLNKMIESVYRHIESFKENGPTD